MGFGEGEDPNSTIDPPDTPDTPGTPPGTPPGTTIDSDDGTGTPDPRLDILLVPVDDAAVTDEDTQVEIDVLANDPTEMHEEFYGDILTVVRVSNPPHGRAWIITDPSDDDRRKVVYEPDPNFNGVDTFKYTVDGASGTGTARKKATVTVTVNSVPDLPIAGDDEIETNVNTPVVINVLANDRDVDGDPLDVTAVADPARGMTILNADNTITYTPEPEYDGTDTFTYTLEADDGVHGTVDTVTGRVTVRVRPPFVKRINRANRRILPDVTRTITDMSQDAISVRFETADSVAPASFQLGGSSDLNSALRTHAAGLQEGTFDAVRFLADSFFHLGYGDAGRGYTVWGGGDYRALSNPEVKDGTDFLDWSGEVVSGHLGADAKLNPDFLMGMMISVSKADFDYVVDVGGTETGGRYQLDLMSFNPYAYLTMPTGMGLWGTVGIGDGDIRIKDELAEDALSSDLEYRSLSLGFRGKDLDLGKKIPVGKTTMTIKGDGSWTSGKSEGTEKLEELTTRNSRLRILAELRHERVLSAGSEAHSNVEFGVRQDNGDGESGTAIELGSGIRYLNHSRSLSINGRAQALLSHNGEIDEWGLSGSMIMDRRPDSQLGFKMSVAPSWGGASQGGAQALWRRYTLVDRNSETETRGRLEATVGYGFTVLNGRYTGTPHAGFQVVEGGRSYRFGYRLNALRRDDFDLNLEGRRHEHDTERGPEHVIEIRSRLHW